ncbi:MAG: phosphatidylglycerophosphatase A [candidate division KSB1 bacterium]|nr:phosphatidylglycerophosphatase A [candidate division KSB1 bacterium]
MRLLARIIATVAFTGFSPVAPGTVGAAIAAVTLSLAGPVATLPLILVTTVLFFLAVWASGVAEHSYGRDASRINVDEAVGMLCTAVLLPPGLGPLAVGFLLFRLFDVVKPFPANRAQALPGGWGVVLDDVIAGLGAGLCARLVFWIVGLL